MLSIGIDVGSGSVRAMALDTDSEWSERTRFTASFKIKTWKAPELPPTHLEQSSEDIWAAVCQAVRSVCQQAERAFKRPVEVSGLGFCATCSLVATDKQGNPVSVSLEEKTAERNVILWADHRASAQAESISLHKHDILEYVGGKVSAEMQLPKVLWLLENLPKERFQRIAHFFDLCDWLTFRATSSLSRSVCPLTCKWNWQHPEGWDPTWMSSIGLGDIASEGFSRLSGRLPPLDFAQPVHNGLCAQSAAELGLPEGTPVAAGLIDAHCGSLGCLGTSYFAGGDKGKTAQQLAIIAGTSNCIIGFSGAEQKRIPGIWTGALGKELWCNEAGQSAAGSMLDFVISSHPASRQLERLASLENAGNKYACIEAQLRRMATTSAHLLTRDVHLTPDFNGNRSPFSRPDMRGIVSGYNLESNSLDFLCILYLAALQSLAYSTRLIIERMSQGGYAVDSLVLCGGLAQGQMFAEALAATTGLDVFIPREPESVLFGGCLLGEACSKRFGEAGESGVARTLRVLFPLGSDKSAVVRPPVEESLRAYHQKKYSVFKDLTETSLRIAAVMNAD